MLRWQQWLREATVKLKQENKKIIIIIMLFILMAILILISAKILLATDVLTTNILLGNRYILLQYKYIAIQFFYTTKTSKIYLFFILKKLSTFTLVYFSFNGSKSKFISYKSMIKFEVKLSTKLSIFSKFTNLQNNPNMISFHFSILHPCIFQPPSAGL